MKDGKKESIQYTGVRKGKEEDIRKERERRKRKSQILMIDVDKRNQFNNRSRIDLHLVESR